MIHLYGITWDHPRGYDSIVAVSELFNNSQDKCILTWEKRSLKDFGDQPIEELVNRFDLLMIDHPFMGEASAKRFLISLENVLPKAFIHEQAKLHIGPCFNSYHYNDRQYALPIDASAQFSAYNLKKVSPNELPQDWGDFSNFMKDQSFANIVIWPLCPTDCWCSFLTIGAQHAHHEGQELFEKEGINQSVSCRTLEFFRDLTINLADVCWQLNPIQSLNLMSDPNRYSYSPLLFGYSNYSRDGKYVKWQAPLSLGHKPISLLGGVGIAISSKCQHQMDAADFIQFALDEKRLKQEYFIAGGQPSLKVVWESVDINSKALDFFASTKNTIENAYTRPRIPGFNVFQERASNMLHSGFRSRSVKSVVDELDLLYKTFCINYDSLP